ncbi:MAG: hypothetical protein AAF460_09600 [Pseudomonadota bacterium]
MFADTDYPDTNQATLVHREASENAEWRVFEQAQWRWLGTPDGAIHAAIDRRAPRTPVLGYIRTMLSGLCLAEPPERVLDLGYGCGTLVSALQQHLPNTRVTSVEQDHAVVRIAHRWFGGEHPDHVVMATAEQYVHRSHVPSDAVFCDLHSTRDGLGPVADPAFHDALAGHLADDGVCIVNLLPADQRDAIALVGAIRAAFAHVWLATVPGCQNLVVFARHRACAAPDSRSPFARYWCDDTVTACPVRRVSPVRPTPTRHAESATPTG